MGLVLYTVAKGIGERTGKLKRTTAEKEIGALCAAPPEPRPDNRTPTQKIPCQNKPRPAANR